MIKYRLVKGCILLALILMVTIVSAAEPQADLNVTKVMSSTGPSAINDTVTWVVTVWNNGPDDATNVILKEDISQLSGHQAITVEVEQGTYNNTTGTWTIPTLANASSTSLTFVTNFSTPGKKTNSISIIDQTPGDLLQEDNRATSGIDIVDRLLLSADLKINPTTLNVNSKGIFTVFVTLKTSGSTGEKGAKPTIDFASSTLTCSEAELIRASVSNKDGGTLIAKFYRQDLQNITNGTGVKVNCSGTLSVNGESVYVEGSDTIRVMGEKKGLDKLFSDLKKFLRIEKDEMEMNETENSTTALAVALNPESYKNKGQLKKVTGNSDDQSVTTTGTQAPSEKTRGPKEDTGNNNSRDKNLQKNNGADTTGKGNNNANGPDNESQGKSNGKKTK
ncbi:MAG: DUF11 domain-containing protein [Methanoregula sp.]|jgi:hypothetical protein|nr:DUF11 domain-containing protein [Methanoregula sp.]